MSTDLATIYTADYFLGTSSNRGNFSLLDLGPKFHDRTQTVIEYFGLATTPPGTIIEIGCGTAPFYRLLKTHPNLSHLKVVCTDVTYHGVKLLDPADQPPFSLASADNLPFDSSTISGIVMWDVLEHLAKPVEALAEVYRILAPHGFLHIVCPNPESWQRDSSDPDKDVYRRDKSHVFPAIVTVKFLDKTLRKLGFTFEQFTRGFPGSDGQSQTGHASMRPASIDSTGTHIVVFARKI